jgi:hypothetical protein
MHYQLISEERALVRWRLCTQDDLRFQMRRQVTSSSNAHNWRGMFLSEDPRSPAIDQFSASGQHEPRFGFERAQMPKLLDFVITRRPVDFIGDQNDIWFLKLYAATVRKAGIFALGFQQITLGIAFPDLNIHFGTIGPSEWSGSHGLIASIDNYSVVRLRSTKPVAPFFLADVGECAGIDQNFLAA